VEEGGTYCYDVSFENSYLGGEKGRDGNVEGLGDRKMG
jgi:hypothetical protein